MKKILVLGSNSFSGSSFVDFLPTKSYKIYCFSRSSHKNEFNRYYLNRKKVSSKKIDISKDLQKILFLVKKIKPNYIINFISESNFHNLIVLLMLPILISISYLIFINKAKFSS